MHQESKQIIQPPNDLTRKPAHSLQADLATGWRPKIKILGPMPLNFDNLVIDNLLKPIMNSDTSIFQIVYLGFRPRDTFKMHELLGKDYHYKYQHLLFSDSNYLKPFFHKFYSEFEPQIKRPFYGMNPNRKSDIIFDSCFQSGNLDCVIRTRTNQYDLILRIDSNTSGHILWYYFKIKNTNKSTKTIRLNVVNLRKQKCFYNDSVRPYIKRNDGQWAQGGQQIYIQDSNLNFAKQSKIYASFNGQNQLSDQNSYRKLSFNLTIDPDQQISVAYSIPYTYSHLLDDLRHFKKLAHQHQIPIEINRSNQSLSGLQIPYLKIMNDQNDHKKNKKKKYCIFIIGRQHPGQSNSSHVLKGFIESLLSQNNEQMKILRRQCVFHIIPMLNPDGVVMGNFRTSLYGKDLNRLFKKVQTLMIPQVQFCRETVMGLSKKYGNKLFMFLDFHGHSVRRNAFFFAPSFLDTNANQDIRDFPKLISSNTEIFRYQSCSFRISSTKKTTARAVFSKSVGLCYTLEASNWSYYSKQKKQIIPFTDQLWGVLGKQVCRSLAEFMANITYRNQKRKQRKSQKNKTQQKQHLKFKKLRLKTKEDESIIQRKGQSISIHPVQTRSNNLIGRPTRMHSQIFTKVSTNQQQLIKIRKQVTEREKQLNDQNQNIQKVNQEQNEGSDDSDGSQQQDMQADKFKKYINVASNLMIQFEKVYYGDQYQQRKRVRLSATKKVSRKRQGHSMQQACLRYQQQQQQQDINMTKKIIIKQEFIGKKQYSGELSKINIKKNMSNRSNANLQIKNKHDTSLYRGLPNQNNKQEKEQEDPKKQILSSLPRISIFNYLSIEDNYKIPERQKHNRGIFKIPKIENHMKISKKIN